jgi:hypothetical protein
MEPWQFSGSGFEEGQLSEQFTVFCERWYSDPLLSSKVSAKVSAQIRGHLTSG